MMNGHQRLQRDDPRGILRTLDQEISQLRNGDVHFIRRLQKNWAEREIVPKSQGSSRMTILLTVNVLSFWT